ncbi:hypothetical protein ACOMHN_061988 [Nucella lapillus]
MEMKFGKSPFTLFIPSDLYLMRYLAAHHLDINTLKQDPAQLKENILYFIVNGTISRQQLYNERMLTALNGEQIRVNSYGGSRLTVQGVPLQSRDHTASNGIIYYLYAPIVPANGTIVDVIASQSDLSTLMTAAHTAGLDAFLADKLTALLANPPLLKEILQYHVVPGTMYGAGIHDSDLPTFEADDRLHLQSHFGQGTIEGGHIIRNGADLSATNGVVHKIDHVLIPESLKSQI